MKTEMRSTKYDIGLEVPKSETGQTITARDAIEQLNVWAKAGRAVLPECGNRALKLVDDELYCAGSADPRAINKARLECRYWVHRLCPRDLRNTEKGDIWYRRRDKKRDLVLVAFSAIAAVQFPQHAAECLDEVSFMIKKKRLPDILRDEDFFVETCWDCGYPIWNEEDWVQCSECDAQLHRRCAVDINCPLCLECDEKKLREEQ